ncbi:MAG TPA: phage tail terminator-like protein [Microvirga sp.]|jgi:hypothetical protein|nr:phage tail terminator-like protein [Microvirga sp.]
MGYASEREAIEGRWETSWNNRTRTAYEGHSFDPPKNAAWCRLTIRNGEARRVSTGSPGSNLHRHVGVIFVEIYTPGGQGTQAARVLADHALAVFQGAQFANITCDTPYVSNTGQESPWLVMTIIVPFHRDELF